MGLLPCRAPSLLWIRNDGVPPGELLGSYSIFSSRLPVRYSLAATEVATLYRSFLTTPFHLPAGSLEQSPTTRDPARVGEKGTGAQSGRMSVLANDLYLVAAKDLQRGSIAPFTNVEVYPTRGSGANQRTTVQQFTTNSDFGSGPTVAIKTQEPLAENLEVSWSDDTLALLNTGRPFIEGAVAGGDNIRFTMEFVGLPVGTRAYPFCVRLNSSTDLEIDTIQPGNFGFFFDEEQMRLQQPSRRDPAAKIPEAEYSRSRRRGPAKDCVDSGGVWWSHTVATRPDEAAAANRLIAIDTTDESHQTAAIIFKLKETDATESGVTFTSRDREGNPLPLNAYTDDGDSTTAADEITLSLPLNSWLGFADDAAWKGRNVSAAITPYNAAGALAFELGLTAPPQTIPVLEDDVVVQLKSDVIANGGPPITLARFNDFYDGTDWTQAQFDASAYSGLHGVMENSELVHLGKLIEMKNFVGDENSAGTRVFSREASGNGLTDGHILQKLTTALAGTSSITDNDGVKIGGLKDGDGTAVTPDDFATSFFVAGSGISAGALGLRGLDGAARVAFD